jgi:hypothetical protein
MERWYGETPKEQNWSTVAYFAGSRDAVTGSSKIGDGAP